MDHSHQDIMNSVIGSFQTAHTEGWMLKISETDSTPSISNGGTKHNSDEIMYEELNCFEEALKHFGTRVEVITAMEMSRRISAEDAYQMIKDERKEVKKCRKHFNKDGCKSG